MSKKLKKQIINFLLVLIVSAIGYFFYGVQEVPQSLYETQIMQPDMKEAYYVNQWCKPDFGRQEYILWDNTRVDCLAKDYAIEFDFAKKWAESIGQSLYYSKMTDKSPAVALILTAPSDMKYVKRIEKVDSNIKIFLIQAY